MSITSTIISQPAQADGSKLVHEQHVDSFSGRIFPRFYTAAPGSDLDANLAAYAAVVEALLVEQEFEEAIQ